MKNQALHLLTLTFVIAGCGNLGAYNPELVDSDAEGLGDADTDADADTDTDTDTDADADADTDDTDCQPFEIAAAVQAPTVGQIDPIYVGVSLWGVVENGGIYDFSIDNTQDSAVIVFEFFDATPELMCQTWFDASATYSASNANWVTDTGGTVIEGYSFNLNANNGYTNCPNMNGILGYTDPRAWVTSRTWRIGIGPMTNAKKVELAAAIGADWATDWEPYIMAQYLDSGGPNAVESGFTMIYPHTCYDLNGTTGANTSIANGPINGYVGNSYPTTVYNMELLP